MFRDDLAIGTELYRVGELYPRRRPKILCPTRDRPPPGRSETVQLSGTGAVSGTAHARLSPPDMKVIAPVGETVTLRFDFENTGTAPLTVFGVALEDEHSYFTGNGDACSNHRLEPGTGCLIEVFFTPTSTVTSKGEILIKHGAPGGPSRARLEGVGAIEETTLPQSGTASPVP